MYLPQFEDPRLRGQDAENYTDTDHPHARERCVDR